MVASTLEKRRNAAAAGGGTNGADATRAAGGRASSPRARSDRDEDDGSDDGQGDDTPAQSDDANESDANSARRGGRAQKPRVSTKAALDFVQLLVFLVVMLQGLTLFVSYHSLLAGQHAAKVDKAVQGSMAQLSSAQVLLAERSARVENKLDKLLTSAVEAKRDAAARATLQRTDLDEEAYADEFDAATEEGEEPAAVAAIPAAPAAKNPSRTETQYASSSLAPEEDAAADDHEHDHDHEHGSDAGDEHQREGEESEDDDAPSGPEAVRDDSDAHRSEETPAPAASTAQAAAAAPVVSAPTTPSPTPIPSSSEQAQQAQQQAEDDALDVASFYTDREGRIDRLRLARLVAGMGAMYGVEDDADFERLMHLQASSFPLTGIIESDPENPEPHPDAVLHSLMRMGPSEMERLHAYRTWVSDPATGDVAPAAEGERHDPAEAMLRAVGQVAPDGSAKDIAVKYLDSHQDERVTVAARDIRAGEYFCLIPGSQLLTSEIMESSPLGRALRSSGVDYDDMVWMAVYVLEQKEDPRSPWHAWLSILPREYSFMPVTMAPASARSASPSSGAGAEPELELISGTLAGEWVSEYQTAWAGEYVSMGWTLRERNFARFTFGMYVWARCVVSSRAFGLEMLRRKMSPAGQPVPAAPGLPRDEEGWELESVHVTAHSAADLINHEGESRKIDAIWGWNHATNQFAFKAVKDIAAGAVISTTYGPRGNTDLFTHYGFAMAHNPFNSGPLCMPVLDTPSSSASSSPPSRAEVLYRTFGIGSDERENGWNSSSCANAVAPSSTAALAGTFRCRLHADLLEEEAHECFSFARIALAPESHFRATILPAFASDEAASRDFDEGSSDADDRPVPSLRYTEPLDWQSEKEVVRFIGDYAARSLALIAGGPLSNDTAILAAHNAAKVAGLCSGNASSSASTRYPTGPCLSGNQWNLIQVRLGEKLPLQNAVDLAAALARFESGEHTSLESLASFLDSLRPSPAEMARLVEEDVTPNWSLLSYFNEALLPLFVRAQTEARASWTAGPDFARSNGQMQERFRKLYQPLSKAEQATIDAELNSFGFKRPA